MARIVVVEDEEAIRDLIIEELNESGHETFPAKDGEQGLSAILEHDPDLILSDITMPKLNGRQLLRKLKENHPKHADRPFIFLSALADQHDVIKGLRIGADDYVTKPIDFDMLMARVEARLRTVASPEREHDDTTTHDLKSEELSCSTSSVGEADPAPDHNSAADGEAQGKASEIASTSDGRIVAGHVETISMQAIREKCGDDWQRVSKRVFRIAEGVIKEQITANDTVGITPTNDFVICFSEINEEIARHKMQEIAKEIRKTLFGETQDDELSQVKAESRKIKLNPSEIADKKSIFSRIKEKIVSQSQRVLDVADKKLINAYQNEFMRLFSVLTTKGEITRMSATGFTPGVLSNINKWTESGKVATSTLLELDTIMISRVVDLISGSATTTPPTVLVPLHYSTLDDERLLDRYIQAYGGINEQMRRHLIFNIVSLPDKLGASSSPFDRLIGIGRTRAIEIENPGRIIHLDLKALNIGIGLIDHHAALQFRDQGLKLLTQKMKSVGAKLIVRDPLSSAASTPAQLGADFVLDT